ncbi:Phospholipid--sterol O-acyltransferase [Camellia lanceoleosa]|uniref:Phospholipid--sterol O-acyltransferase n=1 Tax=Camellia lanceoleosa TaxID=1840588 RepID=A0ACC0FI40_9ERIC|nr:Phospholipid--sterol O-acyltransferase [Camellia lanceoleosa]
MSRSPRVKYITYYEDSDSLPGKRTAIWELDKVSKALSPAQMLSKTFSVELQGCGGGGGEAIQKDIAGEVEEIAIVSGNPFLFASAETS